ncbi:MAG: cation:proton antiporter, partial [Planctomycetaceae bacterium]|nr:cation:proton antiporter [Planctomycetaceae bacterium]
MSVSLGAAVDRRTMSNVDLAVQFFLQIVVILTVCRVIGYCTAFLGQPQVVAEMIAGVALGPSLLGWLAPEFQAELFPWDASQQSRDTQSYLFPASQLGLALYMFVVGLEFRGDIIRSHWRASLAVSLAGMAAPFALGGLLGWRLHRSTTLFPEHTTVFEAAVFLGASLCITAFPMLARIIHFKGLAGTTMGTVAIGAGAIDDATAWCLLAVVLASFDGDAGQAAVSIGGGVLFVSLVMGVVRPVLLRAADTLLPEEGLTETGFVIALVLLSAGAWCTDSLGLHAVFGAFVMGTAMPRGRFSRELIGRIQPLT